MLGCELRIRLPRQATGEDVFEQVVRVGSGTFVAGPRVVPLTIRVASPREIGPSRDKLIGENLLPGIE